MGGSNAQCLVCRKGTKEEEEEEEEVTGCYTTHDAATRKFQYSPVGWTLCSKAENPSLAFSFINKVKQSYLVWKSMVQCRMTQSRFYFVSPVCAKMRCCRSVSRLANKPANS